VQHRRIAKRYARSLFLAGKKSNLTDSFGQELALFGTVVRETEGLVEFLSNPTQSLERKSELLASITKQNPVSDDFQRFLDLLVSNERAQLLPQIHDAFQELLNQERKALKGTVGSATPLSSKQLQDITAALESSTGYSVELENYVNEDFIAGFRVEVGDVVLDNTVAGQLGQLTENLLKASL